MFQLTLILIVAFVFNSYRLDLCFPCYNFLTRHHLSQISPFFYSHPIRYYISYHQNSIYYTLLILPFFSSLYERYTFWLFSSFKILTFAKEYIQVQRNPLQNRKILSIVLVPIAIYYTKLILHLVVVQLKLVVREFRWVANIFGAFFPTYEEQDFQDKILFRLLSNSEIQEDEVVKQSNLR